MIDEVLNRIQQLIQANANLDGARIGNLFLTWDIEHPRWYDNDRYIGTLYDYQENPVWDIERANVSDDWELMPADTDSRWHRFLNWCRCTRDYEFAAGHSGIPPKWAERIIAISEQELEEFKEVIAGKRKDWRWIYWVKPLWLLADNDGEIPDETRKRAEKLAREWEFWKRKYENIK